MIKKTFGAGVNLPPEFLNSLEDLSYSKPSNEVGHLPLPPNYGIKPDVFTSSDGAVDLSTASSEFVFVEHEIRGMNDSIEVNGLEDSKTHTIVLITRGAIQSKLKVLLPSSGVPGDPKTEIYLQQGSSAILNYCISYSTWEWTCYELEHESRRPISHNIDLYEEDPIELSFLAAKEVVIPKSYLQINGGKFDATLEFLIDCSQQVFAGNLYVALVDEHSNQEIIIKNYSIAGNIPERSFSTRFVYDFEYGTELSIKAWFASSGGSVSIKHVKLSGFWHHTFND